MCLGGQVLFCFFVKSANLTHNCSCNHNTFRTTTSFFFLTALLVSGWKLCLASTLLLPIPNPAPRRKTIKSPWSSPETQDHTYRLFKPPVSGHVMWFLLFPLPCLTSGGLERSPESTWLIKPDLFNSAWSGLLHWQRNLILRYQKNLSVGAGEMAQ